jgi:hypothetical protein
MGYSELCRSLSAIRAQSSSVTSRRTCPGGQFEPLNPLPRLDSGDAHLRAFLSLYLRGFALGLDLRALSQGRRV